MLDFDRDPSVAEQKVGQVLNPTNPDLSGFAKRRGKIIIYHGWADLWSRGCGIAAVGPTFFFDRKMLSRFRLSQSEIC